MRAFVAALAFVALPASADKVFKTENAHIRLGEKPCTGKVADLLLPEWREKFKDGMAIIGGKALRLCWIESGPGAITIIDEEGDGATIPARAFKESGA